jgi:hypothetical protein
MHRQAQGSPAAHTFTYATTIAPNTVQRKSACACGGGCPRCKNKLPLQTMLAVSEPGDVYEQEADRVVEHVMRMPAPALQRNCGACSAGGATCASCGAKKNGLMQRKAERDRDKSGSVPEDFLQDLGPGQPLDSATRAFFEPRFDHDFSWIRVHTDARAAESARDVNALAYTFGSHVVFGSGQYAPETERGRRLLTHELVHTVQQGNTEQVRRFVPCEQPSLSLQACPPREKGEVAQSKTDPMTVHGTTWLSENGYPVNGYLLVGFEVGSSAIKKGLRDLLEWKRLVALMKDSNVQWKIQGLSDCSGSKDLNQGIRKARAEAVYNFLPEDARKHVVAKESVPLYECITGNQRRVDRTVNRSVLIEQVGRTVDINPTEEDVIEPKLPKFVCGPDVTRQVAEAVRFARSIFNGWSHDQKVDGCDALISLQGLLSSKNGGGKRSEFVAGCSWDIWELHNNDWINKRFQPTCATTGAKPGCGESVQIDDDCHHAGAVNYVIFGTMFRLCSDNVSDDFYFDFSKSNMKALVDIRKGSGISGLKTPVPNFKGSFAWAQAGYDGWPSVSSPSGDWNHCVPMCPLPYVSASPGPDGYGYPFDIHWHPHRSRYTCP